MTTGTSRLLRAKVFKDAFRGLIKQLGGLEGAETCTRVRKSQLARYQNVDEREFPPIDIVADLEAEGVKPLVSIALAQAAGYVLVPIPRTTDNHQEWVRHAGSLAHECGDVLTKLGVALSDDGGGFPSGIGRSGIAPGSA